MTDLTMILNSSIDQLSRGAIKICIKNPPMAAYLARLRGYLKNAQKARTQNISEGLHIPPFLIASITQSCNLFCSGCYARANGCVKANSENELSIARWRALFEEARSLGVSFILLAGGEPLLRRDIIELAGEFPEIVFPVFTNGTMLGDDYISIFKKYRNLLPVLSLEGEKSATDARRGDGVYDKLEEVMRRLKSGSIFYGVSVTVTKENISHVTDDGFVKGLEKSGCSLTFYVEYVPVDEKSAAIAPDDADRALLAQCIKTLREKRRMMFLSFPGDESSLGGCLAAGRGFFHIAADGSAEPCPFSPFSQLNLKEHSLAEVLRSEFFQNLRDADLLNTPHKGGCVLFENRDNVAALAGKEQ
jgi:MoaA/NifB/PqqE/SkfB family radical SAM enzyme